MKKILLIIAFLSVYQAFCNTNKPYKYVDNKKQHFIKMIKAFAFVESTLKSHEHNIKEDAVGYLQIRPIMFKEINKHLKGKYKLTQRWSKYKSIEMFTDIMLKVNPELDLKIAANFWNCGHTWKHNKAYYEKIKTAYDSI